MKNPKQFPSSQSFGTPLGQVQSAQLVFPNGIARHLSVQADPELEELFQAHFEYPIPEVLVREGEISLHYHFTPILTGLLRQERPAEVRLNPKIPWRLEAHRGTADLTLKLEGLRLEALYLDKGIGHLRAKLPVPTHTVPIRLSGGVADVRLQIPNGVAVGVLVVGGAANLNFDQQHFGAVGSETRWESLNSQRVTDRYDIQILGGAANIYLERYQQEDL